MTARKSAGVVLLSLVPVSLFGFAAAVGQLTEAAMGLLIAVVLCSLVTGGLFLLDEEERPDR